MAFRTSLRLRPAATAASLYFLLTLVMTWPLAANLTVAIPGDGFDGWQNYWNLWWTKVALIDRIQTPFQTDLLYAPTGVDLYFHTLNPFNGLVTIPVHVSGGLLLAYNSVVLLSWTLAGLGVFLLARWLLRSRVITADPGVGSSGWTGPFLPPFVAGLIFTFSPFHMAHLLGHMQVMSLQWIPFYVLSLLRALNRRRNQQPWIRSALLAGLFLILSGLCDWYFVLYLFLFTGLLVGWHWGGDVVRILARIIRQKQGSPARVLQEIFSSFALWVLPPAAAGLSFFLVLSPILVPMIQTASEQRFMVRPESDFYVLSASVADFLIPNRLHTLFREESFGWPGNQIAPVSERTIGIGYVSLGLGLLALGLDKKRSGFWCATTLFFFLMALGPTLHLGNITWQDLANEGVVAEAADALSASEKLSPSVNLTLFGLLNQFVPFMEISRSVSRYALMVQLCVALLAGIGLSALLARRKSNSALFTAVFGLPVLILFEFWVAPFPLSPPDTPAIYQDLSRLSDSPASVAQVRGSVLNLPMNYDRPGYLLYQTVHRRPLTVAYISRDDPRTLVERVPTLQHLRHLGPDILDVDPVQVGLTIFNDLGIEFVILDRYKMPSGLERSYPTDLTRQIFAGRDPMYEDDRITVHQVPPLAKRLPYLRLGPLNWGPLEQLSPGHVARTILEGPAEIHIFGEHDGRLVGAGIEITYRTEPEMGAQFSSPAGLVRLEPAENGTVQIVPLPNVQPDWHGAGIWSDPLITAIQAEKAGTVWVERLRLISGS